MHEWFIVLLLQYLPVIQQSVIVVSFKSHHEMNPCKAEEMISSHLENIKMQNYVDQSRWGRELKYL